MKTRKDQKMRQRLFSASILLLSLGAILASANLTARGQEVKGIPSAGKAPGPLGPAKNPGSASIIVPKLRLRGAEPFHIGGSAPKDLHKIIFTFLNWDKFPALWFQPDPNSPNLPPNPCRQIYTPTRMFLILHSEDGKLKQCRSLTAKEDFYYLFEKDKPMPEFVYVEVFDRTNGMKFKSNLVSPYGGQIK
jgi:hypothetical protein